MTNEVQEIDIFDPKNITAQTVKSYLAGSQDVTNQEVAMFIATCKQLNLNPFLKEVYLIKYKSSPAQIVDNRIDINSHTQNIGWRIGKTAGSTGKGLRLEALVVPDGVEAEAHIEDLGWTTRRKAGEIIGTAGKSLRLEAVKFYGNIKYRVHIQNIGWTDWISSGQVAGTTGKGLRIEAIEIVKL